MFPKNFPGRREKRAEEATQRNAQCASLSLDQRLAVIAARPGESKRERERLLRPKQGQQVPMPAPEAVAPELTSVREPPKSDKKAHKAWKKKRSQSDEE